jgi:hypothetical protein
MKTAELSGAALDWAVSKCEGFGDSPRFMEIFMYQQSRGMGYCYSTDWAKGGAIIEREFITIDQKERSICACIDAPNGHECNDIWANGSTPLIAAMRCYVASVLGDEVELPEELEVTA